MWFAVLETVAAWSGVAFLVGTAGVLAREPQSRGLALELFVVALLVAAAAGLFSLSLWGA